MSLLRIRRVPHPCGFQGADFDFLFSSFAFSSLKPRLTVSPNSKIPANSFQLLNFPASHSNDKYPGTVP